MSNGLRNDIQFFLRIERSIATKVFVVIVGVTNCELRAAQGRGKSLKYYRANCHRFSDNLHSSDCVQIGRNL